MSEWWKKDPVAQGGNQQQWWAKDPVAGTPSPNGDNTDALSRIRTATGGVLEGIPVVGPMIRGGVERAAAATIAPFSGETYDQVLQRIQQGTEAEKAANPKLNTASQITGAVAGTIPMVMAAPEAFGAGSAPLIQRTIMSGLTGSALSGTDAAVRSGADKNAILNGMEWGGALGLAAPGVGALLGAGTRALANRFGPQLSSAEKMFSRAMGRDAVIDAPAMLQKLGPDAMPMDLGPNLQRQAGALAATPGEGQQVIRDAISARTAAAPQRVTTALNKVLDKPVDSYSVADNWTRLRAANAKPAYEAAYNAGDRVVWNPELERLSGSPTIQNAMKGAVRIWQDRAIADGFGAMKPGAMVEGGGNVKFLSGKVPVFPNLQFWDYTKRVLDDKIRMAIKSGQNQKAATLTSLANSLRETLDSSVPEYAAARQAYAGPSAILDALDEGKQAFANTVTPGELSAKLADMTAGEREAYLQGARAKVADIMGTARNDSLAARAMFEKGYNAEKLRLLLGEQPANDLLNRLHSETTFARTGNIVTGNSETAARAAAMDEIGGKSGNPGLVRSALNLRFGDTAADLGDKVIGGVKGAAREKTNAELARLLTTNDPRNAGRILQLAQAAKNRGDLTAQQTKEITQSLMQAFAQRRRPLEITVNPSR